MVFLNFPRYSRTWEMWFFEQCFYLKLDFSLHQWNTEVNTFSKGSKWWNRNKGKYIYLSQMFFFFFSELKIPYQHFKIFLSFLNLFFKTKTKLIILFRNALSWCIKSGPRLFACLSSIVSFSKQHRLHKPYKTEDCCAVSHK